MKVLVTGATGFIGGNVARALQDRDYEVVALVREGSSTLTLEDTGIPTVQGDVRDRGSVAEAAPAASSAPSIDPQNVEGCERYRF